MPPLRRSLAAAAVLGSLSACHGGPAAGPEAPPGLDPTAEQSLDTFRILRDGDAPVYIGGQPSADALRRFAGEGGRVLINLKTDDEMADPDAYRALVEAQGLTYLHLPTPEDALDPAAARGFDALVRSLDQRGAPMLVHCQASGRALYAVAMHRVYTGAMTIGEAIAWTRAQRAGRDWPPGVAALRAVARERLTRPPPATQP